MLADLGASVIRVDRPGRPNPGNPLQPRDDLLNRGRASVAVDLKSPAGAEVVLRLVEHADVLLEGFRPGVTERLGVGPEPCLARNPALVYGRMTGYGQTGPYARRAGHDINYLSIAGVLACVGESGGPPTVPLNVVGDFGGGGMLLAFGVLAALWERQSSGRGQIVDAAIVDGASIMMTMFHAMRAQNLWADERGTNLLDGGAPFYRAYVCADGLYLSVGAVEPNFYNNLLQGLGLLGDDDLVAGHNDRSRWPEHTRRLQAVFSQRPREEWLKVFDGVDACLTPVMSLADVTDDPHNEARASFRRDGGLIEPAAAPRFSRSTHVIASTPPLPGEHTDRVLSHSGFTSEEIDRLVQEGVVERAL